MERNHLPGDAIRDSWVVGYSTKTVIGMWYGYDFIDSEYCLRNLPATVQKDRLFNALVRSGAMESNRSSFKQPSSVVKLGILCGSNPPIIAANGSGNVVYEYFRKGHEPSETATEEKLKTPGNLRATFDEATNKVTISWSGVSPLKDADKSYGKFGYNIYLGATLIDFTTKTSYTYNAGSNPFGTYRVVATYKGYSGAQSGAATFTLKETKKEEPTEPEEPDPPETDDQTEPITP